MGLMCRWQWKFSIFRSEYTLRKGVLCAHKKYPKTAFIVAVVVVNVVVVVVVVVVARTSDLDTVIRRQTG